MTMHQSLTQPRADALPEGTPPRCRANSIRGTTEVTKASYAPVEAVRRALLLLRKLNELRIASVGDLYRETGISKPTIVRMLETLICEGYVARDNFLGGYRVTSRVEELSLGFDSTPMMIEAARPATIELTRRIKWPVSIATPSDGALLVNYTTNSISPWSFPFSVLHSRLQMLITALGRCYFAFCSEDERSEMIRQHRHKWSRDGTPLDVARALSSIRQIREKGYAMPDPSWQSRRFQFLAVPIMDGDRCLAAMGTGFYRRAVPAAQIEENLFQPMQETATRISHEIALIRTRLKEGDQSLLG
jgi:IclR family mhp operon transcriptional activator